MTADASTSGYMRRYKAVSRQSATATYSATNISTITTTALEAYLRAFFEQDGKYRHLLKQFAPGLTQYVADSSFDPESDKTKTKLTIERYNERIAAHPPCIVLTDSGIALKSVGFGRSVAQDRIIPNSTAHHICISREIPVSMLMAATSRADLVTLTQAVHVIFYDLSNFVSGRMIHAENETDTWLIRLPLQMDAGSYDKTNIPDDPQQLMWTSTFSFTLAFEDCFVLVGEDINYETSQQGFDNPSIDFPSKVQVGRKVLGTASNLQVDMKLVTSDPNTAILSPGSTPFEFFLLAKKPGSFELRILHGANTENKNLGQSSMIQPKVVATKQITSSF